MKSRKNMFGTYRVIFSFVLLIGLSFAGERRARLNVWEGNEVKISIEGPHVFRLDNYNWKRKKDGDYLIYLTQGGQIALKEEKSGLRYFLKKDKMFASVERGKWTLNNKRYEGLIDIFVKKNRLVCGCEMEMGAYLMGVLKGELGAGSELRLQAFKAQAIASRTYYYRVKGRGKDAIDPTVSFQHYKYSEKYDDIIKKAVRETEGLILTYQGGPALTVYSADCGGYSASAKGVWGNKSLAYLVSNWDGVNLDREFCEEGDRHYWKRIYSQKEIDNIFMNKVYHSRLEKTEEIIIDEKTESGRVKSLIIKSDRKKYRIENEEIRRLFRTRRRPLGLYSRLFSIEKTSDYWIFQGMGYGHGAGMCQHGAMKMSELGYGYRKILDFYYPGTKLTRVKKGG